MRTHEGGRRRQVRPIDRDGRAPSSTPNGHGRPNGLAQRPSAPAEPSARWDSAPVGLACPADCGGRLERLVLVEGGKRGVRTVAPRRCAGRGGSLDDGRRFAHATRAESVERRPPARRKSAQRGGTERARVIAYAHRATRVRRRRSLGREDAHQRCAERTVASAPKILHLLDAWLPTSPRRQRRRRVASTRAPAGRTISARTARTLRDAPPTAANSRGAGARLPQR